MRILFTDLLSLGWDLPPLAELNADFCDSRSLRLVAPPTRLNELFPAEGLPLLPGAAEAMVSPQVVVIRCQALGEPLRRPTAALKRAYGAAVVAVTSRECSREQARELGVFLALRRPEGLAGRRQQDFCTQLLLLIRNARLSAYASSQGYQGTWSVLPQTTQKEPPAPRLIALGASAGGVEALSRVLGSLPGDLPCILVVQHLPGDFTEMFVKNLNEKIIPQVSAARDGDPLLPGRVYIAPGGMQMTVDRRTQGFCLSVQAGPKVSGHCPSVDALFNSIAYSNLPAIGAILTGMGADGAAGLLAMRRNGAYTIGQDKDSSVVYGMPEAAFRLGAVMKQLPLDLIGAELISRSRQGRREGEDDQL